MMAKNAAGCKSLSGWLLALAAATGLVVAVLMRAEADETHFRARGMGQATPAAPASALEDIKAEIEFGQGVAARILGRHDALADTAMTRYVNLVGNAVALHSGRPELHYRFAVLNTDNINAYAAPGGYVFVTRGALAMMRDEAELAAVLAHEVAHVTGRHIVKALDIRADDRSAQGGLARFLGAAGDPGRVAFAQAVEKAMDILFNQGLQKQDEFAADSAGTVYLASTGYDPGALRRYLERISAIKGERVSVLHATHPTFSERLRAQDNQLAGLGLTSLSYPTVRQRFEQHTKTLQ